MFSCIKSVAFKGLDVILVDVQTSITNGQHQFNIVGLADKTIAESRERVRSALKSAGIAMPYERITVNLSPADINKEGSHYDLPIALGILVALQLIPASTMERFLVMGELQLNGTILPASGVLPAAIYAKSIGNGLIIPKSNYKEARWADLDQPLIGSDSLLQLIKRLRHDGPDIESAAEEIASPPAISDKENPYTNAEHLDIRHIVGHHHAKRALEIAAAGGHNLLMMGPPGSGKSMLAKSFATLLPPMAPEEMLTASMIASLVGHIGKEGIITTRPFRAPHHNCSHAAMVGGGRQAQPGEITLAHHGVLFLDELPEFHRNTLEALRQPMESGEITVARANAHITYPASFQVIAAMNPCNCGYAGIKGKECRQVPYCVQHYQSRISGPLRDRIDLTTTVAMVPKHVIRSAENDNQESSATIRERAILARNIQHKRYQSTALCNATVSTHLIQSPALYDQDALHFLDLAVERLGLSMRGYTRLLRVARTIADLAQSDMVQEIHMQEALSFRGS